ncbi:MAG: ATP-binding protein [Pseudomonadota bacterium]
MLDTLLKQSVAVLITSIVATMALTSTLMFIFVLNPQMERGATNFAGLIALVTTTIERSSYSEWVELIHSASADMDFPISIQPGPPPPASLAPDFVALSLRDALIVRNVHIPSDQIFVDAENNIWMPLTDAAGNGWLTIPISASWIGSGYLPLMAMCLATMAALIGGVTFQRRIARPLRALESHLGGFSTPSLAPKLDEAGPREVAAVARALNEASERLRQSEVDRALLLAGVSHDLRTPLTKLRLSMALFRDVEPELLEGAVAQINRIDAMLAQFLVYARGFEAEEKQKVSIANIVQDAADNTILDGDIQIQIDEEIHALAKRNALVRAVTNLIKNAADYGEKPVVVTAGSLADQIYIDVIDGGEGLAEDEVASLVRPFARGNKARSGSGTGLGLAITQEAARANDGTLEFHKSQDGFRARITLPR